MAKPTKPSETKEFFEQEKKQEEQNEALENEMIEKEKESSDKTENKEEKDEDSESEDNKENENETDDKNKKQKKTSWFFWAFICILVLIIAILAAKIKLTMFTTRPELFGKYFYTWRIQEADDIMVKGTGYNKIKLNTIDPKNKNALNFRKMAEEETLKFTIYGNNPSLTKNEVEIKGLISSFQINEHMPRGPAGQHTLVDENNFTFYYDLLKLRASAILNLGPNKLEEDKLKAFVLKETRLKEENFPIDDILKELSTKTSVRFEELRKDFFDLLRSVYNKDTGYSLTDNNTKLGGELLKEANKIIEKVYPQNIQENKKITEKEIKNFFYNFGTVLNVTAIQSLIYSRMFTFFYFCTLNVELKEIDLKDTKRPFHVARMFAKIFSRVFEQDWSYSVDKANISWIERTLGKKTSCDYSNPKIKESYKKAVDVDNDNIETLLEAGK